MYQHLFLVASSRLSQSRHVERKKLEKPLHDSTKSEAALVGPRGERKGWCEQDVHRHWHRHPNRSVQTLLQRTSDNIHTHMVKAWLKTRWVDTSSNLATGSRRLSSSSVRMPSIAHPSEYFHTTCKRSGFFITRYIRKQGCVGTYHDQAQGLARPTSFCTTRH